jgi:predicted porin
MNGTSRRPTAERQPPLTLAANHNSAAKGVGGIQRNSELRMTRQRLHRAICGHGPGHFTADRTSGYTLGAEVPWGQFLFGANYTSVKYESAAGQDLSLGKVAVGVRYGLSKSTFLYASASQATGDLKDYIAQNGVTQAGLRVAF